MTKNIFIKNLGLKPYLDVFQEMKEFTKKRSQETLDELWILEHHPVFTQGQAGKPEHILSEGSIPIVQSDRGGQVTYHGPGQLIVYTLIDIHRKKYGVKEFVCRLEQAVVDCLREFQIFAHPKHNAPGVYVDGAKICSLGLRIRRGASYHGLALNVNMDLEPFSRINPCGYANLEMVQMNDYGGPWQISDVSERLLHHLKQHLGY